jgi:hypothetical protein
MVTLTQWTSTGRTSCVLLEECTVGRVMIPMTVFSLGGSLMNVEERKFILAPLRYQYVICALGCLPWGFQLTTSRNALEGSLPFSLEPLRFLQLN